MGSISFPFHTSQNQSRVGTNGWRNQRDFFFHPADTIFGSSPRTSLTRPVTSEFDRAFINLKKGISKWKKQNFGHHL